MAQVFVTTGGQHFTVSDEDACFVARYRWKTNPKGRIQCSSSADGLHGKLLSRLIAVRMGLNIRDRFVDHKDHDLLNNQRCNLRAATPAQNNANRRLFRNARHGLKGVKHHPGNRNRPWQAMIQVNQQAISLGYFATKQQAHEAYMKAAQEHYGEFACIG